MLADPTSATTDVHSLLPLLLAEQKELSAVEEFSNWHASSASLASTYSSLMPTVPLQLGQQYAFEVNLDVCSGCKACVVACHNLNGLEETETWRKVGVLTSHGKNGLPIIQHVTTACHHCESPGCLEGCPVKAYEKDEVTGIVKHLDDQCFGCKYCTMMCPYEVPQYSHSLGIVRKCDMCAQRLAAGDAPACVKACPNQAISISIVSRQSDSTDKFQDCSKSLVPSAPPNYITSPTTLYKSERARDPASMVASVESCSDKLQPGHLPLVVMLVLTQAGVGMWGIMCLSMLLGASQIHLFNSIFATTFSVVGVHAALLHLGRPWLAFRSFLGWRTSWLSREAIAFGVHLGFAGTANVSLWLLPNQSILHATLACATTLTGVTAVICSAMIYVATRRHLWKFSRTMFDFGGSCVGLGMVGIAINLKTSNRLFALLGVLICVASVLPKSIDVYRSNQSKRTGESLSARSGTLILGLLIRHWLTLWGLNAAVLVIGFSLVVTNPSRVAFQLAIGVAFALCLISQMIGRWIYFASIVYPRMPGASS